ncbi:MAG: PTS sugar transporter subunit IIA [Treponemataceae bacterium]|nr:PTS sugar transporter subunit IIA [Treponemataceae bacterium]
MNMNENNVAPVRFDSDWISIHSVSPSLCGGSEEQIYEELAALLENSGRVTDRRQLLADISRRKDAGSTSITELLDIPHTQTSGVSQLCAAVGISQNRQIYAMVAWPENTAHCLQKIARLIELLSDRRVEQKLLGAADAGELHGWISSALDASGRRSAVQ